jgi:uncharacterized protein YjeT (DUF2065 family)
VEKEYRKSSVNRCGRTKAREKTKMLKILAILLGLLLIVTRGLIALFPVRFRDVAESISGNNSLLRVLGVFVLILSILIFIALDNDLSGARVIMAIIATISLLGALLILVFPAQYAALLTLFARLPDGAIRFLASIGIIVGVLVVVLGLAYY